MCIYKMYLSAFNIVVRQVLFVGLGRNISLPVSSHDILKSPKTSLVLEVIIDAAITRLWTPRSKIITEK